MHACVRACAMQCRASGCSAPPDDGLASSCDCTDSLLPRSGVSPAQTLQMLSGKQPAGAERFTYLPFPLQQAAAAPCLPTEPCVHAAIAGSRVILEDQPQEEDSSVSDALAGSNVPHTRSGRQLIADHLLCVQPSPARIRSRRTSRRKRTAASQTLWPQQYHTHQAVSSLLTTCCACSHRRLASDPGGPAAGRGQQRLVRSGRQQCTTHTRSGRQLIADHLLCVQPSPARIRSWRTSRRKRTAASRTLWPAAMYHTHQIRPSAHC